MYMYMYGHEPCVCKTTSFSPRQAFKSGKGAYFRPLINCSTCFEFNKTGSLKSTMAIFEHHLEVVESNIFCIVFYSNLNF